MGFLTNLAPTQQIIEATKQLTPEQQIQVVQQNPELAPALIEAIPALTAINPETTPPSITGAAVRPEMTQAAGRNAPQGQTEETEETSGPNWMLYIGIAIAALLIYKFVIKK